VKATISVKGRFHAFDLAAQLEARGCLAQLITSYPKFAVARYGIPRRRVSSLVADELLERAWQRLPARLRDRADPQLFFYEHYERRAAERLRPGADVFVGWSGASLAALRRAREFGMLTVVERGSSHILVQRELLREEYERFGLPLRFAHPGIVDKELAEYEEADYVAIPSSFVRRSFVERGLPEAKLIQLPYGVSLEGFSPTPRQDAVYRVLHCGAVSLRKGCHYLLQAFHELALADAELWMVGPVAPEMRPFQEHYASPSIVFHGPRPQAELHDYYGRCSVFCLASIEEGFAMVIPQAMACGLPVIITENTGGGDVVREGVEGHLVPIRDVEALKRRILELYEDRERCATMGTAARERVSRGLSWDDYGKGIVEAYRGALERRGRGSEAGARG
jgi:glycosyltransferase involved in cell wall biosynthesis